MKKNTVVFSVEKNGDRVEVSKTLDGTFEVRANYANSQGSVLLYAASFETASEVAHDLLSEQEG